MFESISEGLSSITKSTTTTAKKWFSATSNVVKKATSPISDMTSNMAKGMSKHLPFMWDEDVWKKVESLVQVDFFKRSIGKLNRSLYAWCKKAKVPLTKEKLIKLAFKNMLDLLTKEGNYQEVSWAYIEAFRSRKKSLKTKIMTEYNDWNRSTPKKVILTSNQLTAMKEILDSHEESLTVAQKECQDIMKKLTVRKTWSFDAKKVRDDWSAWNKEKIDTLIESKFDLVTAQKKLWYLVLELERLYIKQDKHSNSITKTKIEDLINTKIPAHQDTCSNNWMHISKTETELTSARENTLADIQKRLDSLLPRHVSNTEDTKKRLWIIKKSEGAWKKHVEKELKTQSTLSKKIETAIKKPFTSHATTKKVIESEIPQWDIVQQAIYSYLAESYKKYASPNKDSLLRSSIYQERINRAYDIMLINKELALQTWLLNRINKKQLTALQKGKKYVESVMKKHKAPTSELKKRYTSEIKKAESLIKTYESTKKDLETKNENHKSHISELKKLIKIEQQRQQAWLLSAQGWVHKAMWTYLSTIQSETEWHVKILNKKKKEIEGEIKKTHLHLKDAQETAKTLHDKKREKAVHELEKKLHDQELFLDLIVHHIEHEEEFIWDIAAKSKDHLSQSTSVQKKSKKTAEKVKTGEKETKKMKFAKKVG